MAARTHLQKARLMDTRLGLSYAAEATLLPSWQYGEKLAILERGSALDPNCGALYLPAQNHFKCPNCGAPNSEQVTTCKECGRGLLAVDEGQTLYLDDDASAVQPLSKSASASAAQGVITPPPPDPGPQMTWGSLPSRPRRVVMMTTPLAALEP